MKAFQLNGPNQEFRLVELPLPTQKEGEKVVKIIAASINRRDLWIQKGTYPNLVYPIVLGSDGCGINNYGSDKSDEVIICPSINWGSLEDHQSSTFKVLGMPDQGTFAEYISVPETNIFSKPSHLTCMEAASLPVAGLTAYRALFTKGQLNQSNNVLITGIGGGAAHIALLFAVATGAKVYVTSSSEAKINEAVKLGALGGVKYSDEDWTHQILKESKGFDLIIDSAAGKDFYKLLDLTKPGGRIVFFGATKGLIEAIDPRKVFWNQISILGTTLGSLTDFKKMLAFVNQHQIVPKIKTFDFNNINDALRVMDRGIDSGKTVLKW